MTTTQTADNHIIRTEAGGAVLDLLGSWSGIGYEIDDLPLGTSLTAASIADVLIEAIGEAGITVTAASRSALIGRLAGYSVVEVMPEHLRSSHAAARNGGVYPVNGAQRLLVETETAEQEAGDDEWITVIRDLG